MQNDRIRRMAAVLVLAALAVRAIIPLGYMPGSLLDGEFMLLCPVASAATFELLQDAPAHAHNHSESGDDAPSVGIACPIGSSLFFDAIPEADSPDVIVQRRHTRPKFVAVVTYIPATRRPYPARAPPLS